jgi:hypothetical protein
MRVGVRYCVGAGAGVAVICGVEVFVGSGVSVGNGVTVGRGVGAGWVGAMMISSAEEVESGTGVSKPVSTVARRALTSVAAGSLSKMTSRITLTSTTGIPGVSGSAE